MGIRIRGECYKSITGDECYQCANLTKNIPIGISVNAQNNRQFISVAHENGWIPLPYHDAAIISDYERLSENVAKII